MKITKAKSSILLEFTDEEMTILADSLLDPLSWFEVLAQEKLANCRQRLFEEWQTKLRQEKRVGAIPTDDTELLDLILVQPDYKNRADQEKDRIVPG